ncbi:MAG: hypothetical protein CVU78_05785 [Elusimicrobia bacterium HGW-Elusimicrobia-2]|nr:MAG: hypothetical protein CVU78_05785 [Elusimicrobia bacterium HGW-Elusimicrobia-2]
MKNRNKIVLSILCGIFISQFSFANTSQKNLQKSLESDIQYYQRVIKPSGTDASINFLERVIEKYQEQGLDSMYLISVNEELKTLRQNSSKDIVIGNNPEEKFHEFVGIGIQYLAFQDGFFRVINVFPETPASKSGIIEMDKITKIDGISAKGLTSEEFAKKMEGKIGTEVILTILRNSKKKEFLLKREKIKAALSTQEIQMNREITEFKEKYGDKGIDKVFAFLKDNPEESKRYFKDIEARKYGENPLIYIYEHISKTDMVVEEDTTSENADWKKTEYQEKVYDAKTCVAVFPFQNDNWGVTEKIISDYMGMGYKVVERNELSKITNEWKISLSGLTENKCIEVGNILNADYIIVGSAYSTYQPGVKPSPGQYLQAYGALEPRKPGQLISPIAPSLIAVSEYKSAFQDYQQNTGTFVYASFRIIDVKTGEINKSISNELIFHRY